ncbi:head-to-tail adaptor [Microbacterium phage Cen1621]|uniref:Head-to-tail adaptor n=1 Tax=Microbacterium phage Cen1621 TaxID=2965191 RepID=A0A9E7QB10_9CAUD|nr:head-to-tail adaptor [Microbacterium phage Cen1621]
MTRPLPPALSALERRLGLPEGSLDGPDKARAEDALADAVTLVLAEVAPTLADKWRAAAPEVVELVVLTAARRGYENPRGINQETLLGHTVGLSESTGVYLTARELQQVRRAATGRRKATGYVGSIRTPSAYTDADAATDTAYVGVSDGSAPVPLLSLYDLTGA